MWLSSHSRVKIMKHLFRSLAVVPLVAGLSSCAGWGTAPVHPGQTEPEVIQQMGKPTHVYQDGTGHLLEYMHGRMGQTTYLARIGPDGKLVSYDQVLTSQMFGTIRIGEADKDKVLRTVGAPSETRFYTLSQLEAWSYPFKESGVWDSLMSVYFDKTGIVRKLESGPDPMRNPDGRGRHR
jgi:hypothetical protein